MSPVTKRDEIARILLKNSSLTVWLKNMLPIVTIKETQGATVRAKATTSWSSPAAAP